MSRFLQAVAIYLVGGSLVLGVGYLAFAHEWPVTGYVILSLGTTLVAGLANHLREHF